MVSVLSGNEEDVDVKTGGEELEAGCNQPGPRANPLITSVDRIMPRSPLGMHARITSAKSGDAIQSLEFGPTISWRAAS